MFNMILTDNQFTAIATFEDAKQLDEQNEKMPPMRSPQAGRRSSRTSATDLFKKLTV